jgi:membrane protein YqaA with SNARE-associated domain
VKKNYLKIAINITIFSVLGGMIAYCLGYFLIAFPIFNMNKIYL